MPRRDSHLPRSVYLKGAAYYHVRADGKRRIWTRLSAARDGLPAMYAALAQLLASGVPDDRMPALCAAWQRDVMPRHAASTQRDETAMCRVIADSFAEFRVGQVQASDIAEFLAAFRDRPRTHNGYRGMLRELLRYAVERGLRTDNPVQHIRTLPTPARTRYITDSELRRIKIGGIYGDDGRRTRSGLMLAALIDLCYLTGQRIGDVLELRWQRDPDDPDAPHVAAQGLRFRPAKTRGRTGAAVLIEWTPSLRATVERIRALHAARLLKRRAEQRHVSGRLITGQDGKPLSYWGASSAWRRAVKRAGVRDVHLHDVRAKALTDTEARGGMQAARVMGAHSTEQQTADYVRARGGRSVKATR